MVFLQLREGCGLIDAVLSHYGGTSSTFRRRW